jgi:membrane protease YdiL (CAAX protease family)
MHRMPAHAANNQAVTPPTGARIMRIRVACWVALVAAIATLNYASRFGGGGGSASARNAVYSWSTFANGMIVYAFWLGLVLAIAVDRWDLLVLRKPRSWARAATLAIGAVLAIYVLEAIVSVIPLPQSPSHEQGLTPTHWEPKHAAAFAANLVLFAVMAPIVEELTFRGVGQSLLSFLGRWPSMILVGLAFGAAHGLVEALLVLVPFGIALAWLRDRTKSVVPGMIVHALFNGIALGAAVLS